MRSRASLALTATLLAVPLLGACSSDGGGTAAPATSAPSAAAPSAPAASAPAESGPVASPSTTTNYDGKIELTTDGTTLTGTAGQTKVGLRIQFSLTNRTEMPVVLQVKDASGAVAAESVPVPPTATGMILTSLGSPGAWTLVARTEGKPDVTTPLTVAS